MIEVLGDGTLARVLREHTRGRMGDLIWVAYDTPVDETGTADVDSVVKHAAEAISDAEPGTIILISSQLPVGTCAQFEAWYPELRFAVHPENLRVERADEDFRFQARVIIGTRHHDLKPYFVELFSQWTNKMLFMSPESAEMVKHALNGFLALSVEYANEIAVIARAHGADPRDVAEAVMADPRVGRDAYLKPDREPGPHLLREIRNLQALGSGRLIGAVR